MVEHRSGRTHIPCGDQAQQQDAEEHAIVLEMDGVDEEEARMQEQRRCNDASHALG